MSQLLNVILNLLIVTNHFIKKIKSKKNYPKQDVIISWAESEKERYELFKLRYEIFAKEMGANISCVKKKIDKDIFDDYCEHLIARDGKSGKIIGTYRVLTPFKAKSLGYLYSETEFDLGKINLIKDTIIEVGRACVHKNFRTGNVIMMLWAELAKFMKENGFQTMIGCTSVSTKDGGHMAASIYKKLYQSRRITEDYEVIPKSPLSFDNFPFNSEVENPPLLKGYLRAGAKICGAPAWDPDFNTADFLTMLNLKDVPKRYAEHFLKEKV